MIKFIHRYLRRGELLKTREELRKLITWAHNSIRIFEINIKSSPCYQPMVHKSIEVLEADIAFWDETTQEIDRQLEEL